MNYLPAVANFLEVISAIKICCRAYQRRLSLPKICLVSLISTLRYLAFCTAFYRKLRCTCLGVLRLLRLESLLISQKETVYIFGTGFSKLDQRQKDKKTLFFHFVDSLKDRRRCIDVFNKCHYFFGFIVCELHSGRQPKTFTPYLHSDYQE